MSWERERKNPVQARPGMPRECRTAIAMCLILRDMGRGKRFSTDEVALRWSVSRRSAQRWMDTLARHTGIEYSRGTWGLP